MLPRPELRLWLVALLSLLGVEAFAVPKRIVSLNLASDHLLLVLADPDQIAALTWFARDPRFSSLHREASAFPAIRGEAEEVLLLRPDAVLVGRYSAPQTTDLLRRLGRPLYTVEDPPKDFEAIESNLRLVGEVCGHPERAEQAIRALRKAREDLAAIPGPNPPLRLLPYEYNAWSPGRGTLFHRILLESGHRPVAEELGFEGYVQLPLERVLLLAPDAVVVPETRFGAPALADLLLEHPVWGRPGAPTRIQLPESSGQAAGLESVAQARALRLWTAAATQEGGR